MNTPVKYHLGKFPPDGINLEILIPLIAKAHHALGFYDAFLTAIPKPHMLLSPLITREAVFSSKIEGINVSVSDVLEYESGLITDNEAAKKLDAAEVVNCREALILASEEVSKQGLDLSLLRRSHAVLLDEVRGKRKTPGAFRKVQNWIGRAGCSLNNASFVPIEVEFLEAGIEKWVNYYREFDVLDKLVQLAMIHVEFEALHPFLDGNGRIGRILIPLFLFEKELINKPCFFMSGYLEANKDQYIYRMRDVSENDAWTEWCSFFLTGIIQQAEENQKKIRSILNLRQELQDRIRICTKSQYSANVADCLISSPFFDRKRLSANSKQSKANTVRIINSLVQDKVIVIVKDGAGSQGSLYKYEPILDIIE